MKEIISAFLQRLSDRDADGIEQLFSEDIDWYVPGNPALPWIGYRTKKSDVAAYFQTMWPHFETGKSQTTLNKLFISGDDAVIFASFKHTAASTKRSLETPVALHLTIMNNKIIRLHLYEDTWAVSNAFFD
jgi:ketosteroid isomerase-like protein